MLLLTVLLWQCKKDNFKETATLFPTVLTTDPANLATNVPLNQVVKVTFKEPMDATTIIPAAFSLTGPGTKGVSVEGKAEIPGTLTFDAATNTMSFVPTSLLAESTTYTGTVSVSVKDLHGNYLQANFVWTFITGTFPSVISTVPANTASGVAINSKVLATFSEPMDPLTITATTFTLKQGLNSISGTVTYTGLIATFTPAANLAANTVYNATITTGAKNVTGNAVVNYTWSFTTGATVDLIKPTIISTVPLNLATGVGVNTKVSATFSKAMDPLTILPATFTLKQGVTSVPGAVTYIGMVATFTPTATLAASTLYTATVTSGVKDLEGNTLLVNYVWTFTTGTTADSTPPTAISTVPVNNATGVALNTKLTATFSEAMDPLTILPATFTLKQGVTPVAGAITYIGLVATFTPAANLTASTLYTATITTGAKDLSGNAIAVNYVWTFTTGIILDVTSPTVISTTPLNAATGVAVNTKPTATFSKTMDLLTISGMTFTLKIGSTPVSGIVTYSGLDATFTPTVDLVGATVYTATITTGAKDLSGNPLAGDYVWKFTTVVLPPLGPGAVNLGTAGNFAAIGKAGISTTGVSSITGDIGVSPASATAITGFGLIMDGLNTFATTPIVVGKVYASDYTPPTPAYMTTAVSDMENALTSAMGMTTSVINELGAGDISGMTLVPGLYKFSTGLLITNAGVTLSGGPNDTWVFQIAQDLTVNNTALVTLSGGALAKNIFWVTSTQAVLGTTVDFKGNILSQTLISVNTGSTVLGRLLAQTAVTLNAATIIKP